MRTGCGERRSCEKRGTQTRLTASWRRCSPSGLALLDGYLGSVDGANSPPGIFGRYARTLYQLSRE